MIPGTIVGAMAAISFLIGIFWQNIKCLFGFHEYSTYDEWRSENRDLLWKELKTTYDVQRWCIDVNDSVNRAHRACIHCDGGR